ncbi:MAG: T9SS type A sorting domain-containing protein [Aureispira sp.]
MKLLFTTIVFLLLGTLGLQAQTVLLETFDNNSVPAGWTRTQTTGDGWKFGGTPGYDVSTIQDHTGNGGEFAWVDFSSTDAGVILEAPVVDVSTLTTPYLQFYFESHYSGALSPFNFMYLEAWNGTTWVIVNTFQGNTPFGWDEYGFNMSAYIYNGGDIRFRFRCESGGAGSDFYNDLLLDDVEVLELPTCPKPSNLVVTNPTVSTADLAWVENGTATNWQIQYGPQNFSLGSGTITSTTTNPSTVTGLNPSSTYSVYVRSVCGPGDTSQWVGPVSFATACATITPPWIESFNSTTTPICWAESGSEPWRYNTFAGSAAVNAGDHTGNNGNYAWIDGSFPSGANQISSLETPFIDATVLASPLLSFWVFSNNVIDNTYNTLEVEVYDGANWNLMQTINSDQGPTWNNVAIGLAGLTITGPIKARFTVTENSPGTSFYNDILIDDIEVKEAPNVGIAAILGVQPVYCNAAVNVEIVIENKSSNVEGDIPWAVESDGAVIASGIVTTLAPNAMDTIPLSLGGVGPAGPNAMITVYTSYAPDQTLTDDTLTATMGMSYTGVSASVTSQVGCAGDANGEIAAMGQNGLLPYSYAWSSAQTTATATGLAAGTYTLTVTDSIGCSSTAVLTLNDPPVLNVAATGTNLTCNGDNSGMITTSISGGVPGYSYLWSNGDMSPQLMNAAAGTYMVSVTDANGCILTETVTLTEPTALVAIAQDNGNGSATAMASGGTAPYTYQWDPNANNQTTQTATGLVDGDVYYVVVTDADGCSDVFSFQASVLVSTTSIAAQEGMELFPNPTSGNAFLDMKTATGEIAISITNTTGQVVFQQNSTLTTGQLVELPTAKLAAGVYAIQATNGTKQWTKKLVVVK